MKLGVSEEYELYIGPESRFAVLEAEVCSMKLHQRTLSDVLFSAFLHVDIGEKMRQSRKLAVNWSVCVCVCVIV